MISMSDLCKVTCKDVESLENYCRGKFIAWCELGLIKKKKARKAMDGWESNFSSQADGCVAATTKIVALLFHKVACEIFDRMSVELYR